MTTMPDDSALIIVDVQLDFCPGGALAVNDGAAVVPKINRLTPFFPTVVLTQDWHPSGHTSFASTHVGAEPFSSMDMPYGSQILWPDHCIQGTQGSAFHPDLDVLRAQMIVRKGFRPDIDSYSAFFENDQKTPTGLAGYLSSRGVTHVYLCGLATDFCVCWSALDARKLGLEATLLEDACRSIDLNGSLNAAMEQMKKAGVRIDTVDNLTA